MTASSMIDSMAKQQTAMAGAVFRRAGSVNMLASGSLGRYAAHFGAYCSFVDMKIDDGSISRVTRSKVFSSSDLPLKMRRNCFGFSSDESGRSREPTPPARMRAVRVMWFQRGSEMGLHPSYREQLRSPTPDSRLPPSAPQQSNSARSSAVHHRALSAAGPGSRRSSIARRAGLRV